MTKGWYLKHSFVVCDARWKNKGDKIDRIVQD